MGSKRIALISGGIPLGGSTTFLINLAGELVRRKSPVMVGSLEADNPYAEDFRRLGIPLYVEDDRTRIFEDRIAAMLGQLRAFRPDVVVACLGPSSYEVFRYVPTGVRRLGMIQSDYPENYPPFAPYVPYLDGMVGVSRQIETNLHNHPQLGRVPTYYLPYGIAVPEQCPGRIADESRIGEPLRILYLGRLERPQKRVHLFPQILRQLGQSGLPFIWTIAGDGPERDWLHTNLPAREGNVQVHFAGPVHYRDVPSVLRCHDIFLLPSQAEGLPLSLLEAMAHGVVPVVSDLASGISEVADRTSAMLIPPHRVEGYAEAMIWLAQHPEESAAMANRAAELVRENYSASAMTDRWLAVVQQSNPAGHSANWPDRVRVKAPLGHNSLRFSPPLQILRRWWRQRSSRAERQRSSPT
jgi:glycosyltransferase involved in cell wall biosynthesis